MKVEREAAETWAGWFRALGDASRIMILNLLATSSRPRSVGEVVTALDIGQSTVSHHLKTLADVGFVVVERRGTSSLYRVNDRCLEYFPSAAQLVMGRVPTGRSAGDVPWLGPTRPAHPRVTRKVNR